MEQYNDLLTGSWDIVAAIRFLAARITSLEQEVIRLQTKLELPPIPQALLDQADPKRTRKERTP